MPGKLGAKDNAFKSLWCRSRRVYWCARLSAQAIVHTPNPIRIT